MQLLMTMVCEAGNLISLLKADTGTDTGPCYQPILIGGLEV